MKLRVRWSPNDLSWEVAVVGEEISPGTHRLVAWLYTDSAEAAWQVCRDVITSGGRYGMFMNVNWGT